MHAYLIMAHNQWELLCILLKMLDDERNDIFIHINSKIQDVPFDELKKVNKRSRVIFTDRLPISWGDYSIILAELCLINTALNSGGHYDYLHLISGQDLPINSQDTIHAFFDEAINQKFNFINFHDPNKIPPEWYDRIGKYNFFTAGFRSSNLFVKKISKLSHKVLLIIQSLLNIDRISEYKKQGYIFNYGATWFSITEELAQYILNNQKFIEDVFCRYTFIPDEMFIQTLVFSSGFKDTLYIATEHGVQGNNNMRLIDWERGRPYIWHACDKNEIENSPMFFARKFDLNVDREIIEFIYNKYT